MKTFEIEKTVPGTSPIVLPSMEDGYASYVLMQPEIVALDASQVLRVTVDVPRACAIALGAMPAIRSLRPMMVEFLPKHPVATVDKLSDYVFAAYYAHLMSAGPARDIEAMQALQTEAAPIREHMLIQGQALAHKGLMDPGAVAAIPPGTGYLDLANDLIALSLMFRTTWSAVQNKTTVTKEDCERADQLGREILARVGARLQPGGEPATIDQAMDLRARAFTLFVGAYDVARQAANYLRWKDGDADDLVPSLFLRSRSPGKGAAPAVNPEGGSNGTQAPNAPATEI